MFVTGCHRSGTSLLASILLDALRVESFSKGNELQEALDNPYGFYESKKLTELNDNLLHSIGSSWNLPPILPPHWSSPERIDEFCALRSSFMEQALQYRWLDKDPRLCLTYGAYSHILLRRVALVVIIRDPLEVATSLFLRNAMPLERGLALWYLYNHHLSFHIQPDDQIFEYTQLLSTQRSQKETASILESINTTLAAVESPIIDHNKLEMIMNERIDTKLNRSSISLPQNATVSIKHSKLLAICKNSFKNIQISGDKISTWRTEFGSIPSELSHILSTNQWIGWSAEKDCQANEIIQRKELELRLLNDQNLKNTEEIDRLRKEISAIRNSRSWKLTKPLRWCGNLIGR